MNHGIIPSSQLLSVIAFVSWLNMKPHHLPTCKIVGMANASSIHNSTGGTNNLGYSPTI